MVNVGDYGNIAEAFDHEVYSQQKRSGIILEASDKGQDKMVFQSSFQLRTRGRGSYPVGDEVQARVAESGIQTGICLVFLHHTSASLMLCENADPEVRSDLERFMARLVPDGDPIFRHVDEGSDDMPAHVRSILTSSSLGVPVSGGRCDLGVWQGIYLWEHRRAAHRRQVSVTVYGE
jgi:secondary thiamine-phosphate synthase enzyme